MQKGLLALVVVVLVGLLGYMATHQPPRLAPKTETAADLKAEEAPAAAQTETAAPAEQAAAPAETPAPETTAEEAPAPAPAAASATPGKVDVELALSERAIGNPDAPVTVIEYASLTCPHCAHFTADILPQVKAKLVDTGKIRIVYRDFPIDALAMKAAKMARCAPKDKYFDLIEVIFKNRERWIAAENPEQALMRFGALSGMDDAFMRDCIASPEMEMEITKGMQEAQGKYQLKATPSFVFNYGAEVFSGAQGVEKFEEVADRLIAEKKK